MPTPARVALLLALTLPLSALAQDADVAERGDTILQYIWTSEENCSERNAVDSSFAEIAAGASNTLNGKCVRLEGYWRGRGLYADRNALRDLPFDGYLPSSSWRGPTGSEPLWPQGRIGLYARPESFDHAPEDGRKAQAYGVVRTCDVFDGYLMVLGYCHYVGGPILIVSKIELSN